MVSFSYTVQDARGLHAQPVVVIAKEAMAHQSTIDIACGDSHANAKDLMELMALGARGGDILTVTVEGSDETAAAEALRAVFTF